MLIPFWRGMQLMDPGLGDLKTFVLCDGDALVAFLFIMLSMPLLLPLPLLSNECCKVGSMDLDLPFCRFFLHREIMTSIELIWMGRTDYYCGV
jgi:hypothetical protein